MECLYLSRCIFYNDKMPMDQGIGAIYKKKYCLGNHEQCARYIAVEKLGQVPDNLYPNMHDIALALIQDSKAEQ